MESSQTESKVHRVLYVLRITRVISGILAIGAIVYMIACAVVAMNRQEDSWAAMKWPLIIAVGLLWLFVRSTKKILSCKATNNQ
jgi:quinol-cytochrome oxidoreductase complex cytochrome b subunit